MFDEINNIQARLKGWNGSYWVAGGWAVDLFLKSKTREHKDIEIATARGEQALLLELPDLSKIEVMDNNSKKSWDGTWLALPIHEIYCQFTDGQTLEVLLNEFDHTHWFYRRNKSITRPKDIFPDHYLPIEIVLLFKTKQTRAIDQMDFAAAIPAMNDEQKSWLYKAVQTEDPSHPWLALI